MTSAGRLRLLMKLVKVKQDEPNLNTDKVDNTTLYEVKNDEKCQLLPTEKYSYINSITHKFLVKGHSQNEGDCVHSVIERTVKKCLKAGPICIPAQYITLIRGAKKTGRPYQVNEMSYDSFFDLKNLAEQSLIGTNLKDSSGEVVKITSVAMFRFEKENPQTIFFKTSYSEKEFCEIYLKERRSKTRSNINELKQLYSSKVGAEAKKPGLLKLLEKNVIPKSYAFFYENL